MSDQETKKAAVWLGDDNEYITSTISFYKGEDNSLRFSSAKISISDGYEIVDLDFNTAEEARKGSQALLDHLFDFQDKL